VISPDTISQVRERTDILAVIQESVPTLKRRGRSFVGLCPFHKEKTPSFHVNPDRGFFHCFGCQEAGGVIDFVMKLEGSTFPEAVRALAERAGIAIEADRQTDRAAHDRAKRQKDELYNANQVAAHFFEEQLRTHPLRQYALDELARRGIVPGKDEAVDDVLQAFRIGYAPPAWDGLTGFFRAQGVSPVAGETVGVLVPRSSGSGHYDRFRHRLMFAVTDPQGRVVAFSGRALELPPDAKENDDKPAKYINSPESPIYTKGQMLFGLFQARHAIRQEEEAILVEGNFDVVSLHARGLQNVVAPLGTAFTADQAKLLRRFAPSVVFLFDADAAGKKAVRMSRDAVKEAGLLAKVAHLPDETAKDPDEFVRMRGKEALLDVLAHARGMLEFLLESLLDQSFAHANAHEQVARAKEVERLLVTEDDPLVRSMAKSYADQLAGRLDVHGLRAGSDDSRSPEPFRALVRSIHKALASQAGRVGPTPRNARIKPRAAGSAERAEIVGALLEYPSLLNDPSVQEVLLLLEGNSARTVHVLAQSLIREKRSPDGENPLDTSVFLEQIPPATRGFATKRLAAPRFASKDEARGHLLENANKLKRAVLSMETNELVREQHERAGDWQAETALARAAEERARMKHRVGTRDRVTGGDESGGASE
jgi:DNA primase